MQNDIANIHAKPSVTNATELYIKYQTQVFKSIVHIARAAAGPLEIDISGIEKLAEYFKTEQAAAYIFAMNTLCVGIMKQRSGIEKLKNTLIELNTKPIDELIFVSPDIVNLSDVSWMCESVCEVEANANRTFEANREFYTLNAEIKPVQHETFMVHKGHVKRALKLIRHHSPEYFEELCRYISIIGLYDGTGISGWSSQQHIGAIFIRNSKGTGVPDKLDGATVVNAPATNYYVEQLIHETAHVHLDLIMTVDPLIMNGNEAIYVSPIRYDRRPMRGVFHAVFVLCRIFTVLKVVMFNNESENEYNESRLKILHAKVNAGIAEIEKNAMLTDQGEKLIFEMKTMVSRL